MVVGWSERMAGGSEFAVLNLWGRGEREYLEPVRTVVLQSCQHGLGRHPDILQECENHGHLCSNGDTSNLR
jgi:hypothetical protein